MNGNSHTALYPIKVSSSGVPETVTAAYVKLQQAWSVFCHFVFTLTFK